MALDEFLKLSKMFPEHAGNTLVVKIHHFLRYMPQFHKDILLAQPSTWVPSQPPQFLPKSILILMSNLLEETVDTVQSLWDYLKECIWHLEEDIKSMDGWFNEEGSDLSFVSIYPYVDTCIHGNCNANSKHRKLQKADQTRALLYTFEGLEPAWVIRFQCEDCKTAYYPNYFVMNGERHYYRFPDALPDIIQAGEHQYIKTDIVKMWINDMNVAWKSFTNCARTYHLSFPSENVLPSDWPLKGTLKGDHVRDAFTIVSLLEDCQQRETTLVVPHTGDQEKRFDDVIKARNDRMRLYGQQEVFHRCNKCTRIYKNEAGEAEKSVWVVVMDGVTLGHPTCAHHNCKTPLTTSRDRYCADHRSLNNICVVKACGAKVREGKKTCTNATHIEVERLYTLKGQSRVLLQERLQRQSVSHPSDGLAQHEIDRQALIDDEEEEEFTINLDHIHGTTSASDLRGTSATSNGSESSMKKKRIAAQFGRKRTHNKQILVAPCGVILARATFYGAEAISSCVVSYEACLEHLNDGQLAADAMVTLQEFIQSTFCINGSKPNHIFFDNNCSLARHVNPSTHPFFKDIGLTVDVFHFNCKHAVTNEYCQKYCNPALFPELHGEDGKAWYFNSSIAEQTNVWLGGFHSIVREMVVHRYNFFLDQMIILRNKITLRKLHHDGQCPIILKL